MISIYEDGIPNVITMDQVTPALLPINAYPVKPSTPNPESHNTPTAD